MASEVEAAKEARSNRGDTIFGKIARGEIPCSFIYEDSQVGIWFISEQVYINSVSNQSRCLVQIAFSYTNASQLNHG